jgi:hypothetical protein
MSSATLLKSRVLTSLLPSGTALRLLLSCLRPAATDCVWGNTTARGCELLHSCQLPAAKLGIKRADG